MMAFAGLIAILPLMVAGQSIIRVARDELKSAANEQLAATVGQLSNEFNRFFEYSIATPLDLIRNAIGGTDLDGSSKIAILKRGIEDLPDVVALQVNVEGVAKPIIVAQGEFLEKLKPHTDQPLDLLRVDPSIIEVPQLSIFKAADVIFLEEADTWIATSSMPIENGIGGRQAILHARINLNRLKRYVANHRFNKTGTINVVDKTGRIVFGSGDGQFERKPIMEAASQMLSSKTSTISVSPFELENGEVTLSALSPTRAFPWVIIAEKTEADAYQPVTDMIENLVRWLAVGVGAAIIGAFLFSRRISRPILQIGETAMEIAQGNLDVRVKDVNSRDEIGDLASRFNTMIVQLNERFELQKFVSAGTMQAIQSNESKTVSLGGDRRRVAILFADIRGYTAFSENRDPEEVVTVLNHYFQRLSDIVIDFEGDIDKFVGDQIMAVFTGDKMSENATRCAIEIMDAIEQMMVTGDVDLRIGIGIDVGEVVVGAMGANQRKDFTVLGDHVNLAARLCSKALADQTLISKNVMNDLPDDLAKIAEKLDPIKVKGKTGKIVIYGFTSGKTGAVHAA